MNLDLFNNLINNTKESGFIQNFIKELGEFMENNLFNNERNQESLVQKILDGRTLTTRFRDLINIERQSIINSYSREHGEIYYIYNKEDNNTYGIVSHKNGESNLEICAKESQLPKGAGVDSVLRVENGKFVLDENATKELQEELTEMINKLLEEQANRLESQRVEGHIYSFVEKYGDIVELIDETNYTGECFEEIDFPSEIANKANQGDMFKYINGEYQIFK